MSILTALKSSLTRRSTSTKARYAELVKANDPTHADELAAVISELGIGLPQVEQDVTNFETYNKLADTAAGVDRAKVEHEKARDALRAFEKRKAETIAALTNEETTLTTAMHKAQGKAHTCESARARRAQIETQNAHLFKPNEVKFEDLIAE